MTKYGVVLFYTSSSAIKAEKVLKHQRLSVKLIPTPRELSSDCGVSLRFEINETDNVKVLLNESKTEYDSIHII